MGRYLALCAWVGRIACVALIAVSSSVARAAPTLGEIRPLADQACANAGASLPRDFCSKPNLESGDRAPKALAGQTFASATGAHEGKQIDRARHRAARGAGGLDLLLELTMLAVGFAGSISNLDTGRSLAPEEEAQPLAVAHESGASELGYYDHHENTRRDRLPGRGSTRVVIIAAAAAPDLPRYLARQISNVSDARCQISGGKPPRLWASLIRNTHLWTGAAALPNALVSGGIPADVNIVVDPSGAVALPCAHEVWRFETEAGAALFAPFTQSDSWHRPPFVAHTRLVRYKPGSLDGTVLGRASVGTRLPFPAFLNHLAEVAGAQLRVALTQWQHPAAAEILQRASTSGGSLAKLAGSWVRYQASRWSSRFYSEHWCVGIVRQPLEQIVATGSMGDIVWLDDGLRTAYLADPFVLPGTEAILCEEYPYDTGVGRIIKLDPKTGTRQTLDLCGASTHRSYPYTWAEAGEVYLIPESTEDRESILYKLRPDGTVTAATVIGHGIRMADPTIFRAGDLYWIAFADLDIAHGGNLSLLYADKLLGPWHPHPLNPVKIDVRSSRPAGTPFWKDGVLYRPGQDCSRTYGWGVAINRVTEISPSRYTEITERWFHPGRHSRFADGMHTLTAAGDCTLVDGKRFMIRSDIVGRKIAHRLGLRSPDTVAGRASRPQAAPSAGLGADIADEVGSPPAGIQV